MTLEKSYQPADLESYWIKSWAELGYAQCSTDATKPNFCIQLPPPNVTGTLHMGHAFNQTIMDALTRYHRMMGFNTLWQPGTDHAGIATQLVVERQLQQQEQKTRHDLGREAFISKIWAWKEQSGNTITSQMRRLGASVDWAREYFTMDEQCSSAVTEVFVRLYEQGLIYRGKRLVNWDPVLKTAVSDLEVETVETEGFLWHIQYPLCEPDAEKGLTHLTVATTRPETLLGDVAVMVHPEDDRYRHLIGKTVQLPLCNRTIPIIADAYVDSSFGTGVVKVTPAHDFNDYAVGQRHGLPLINIFTLDANVNENAPSRYIGLGRFDARKTIVDDLQNLGLLADTKPHKLMVPKGDRTGAIIEPMLTDQWFVATNKVAHNDPSAKSLTQKAIDAVTSGEVKFVPEQWVNTYMQWMNNIQDWCISRQLWWGHRIPAWYGDNGKTYVARNLAEAQTKAKQDEYSGPLHQDVDVLDTWFSSALVPFSTLGWPNETPELQHFLPSSVLVTGFDIIFFWVARMIMMTTHFTGKVPFHTVYVHGLVRDAEGKKMSKSVGNTLDPVDLIDGCALETLVSKRTTGLAKPQDAPKIEKRTRKEFPDGIPAYGADALRFTFASLASLGRNINFDQKRCEGYRNFCNKLWNATRFVLMNTEGHDCGVGTEPNTDTTTFWNADLSIADKWMISTLQRAERDIAQAFATFRIDLAAQCLYQLVWDEYCDWYLEIAKVQLANGDAAQQRATRRTLIRVLETILRLAHPIIPFITESLWQAVSVLAGKRSQKEQSHLMIQAYPVCDTTRIDETAEAQMQQLKSCIEVIRALRGEMSIGPGQKVPLLIEPNNQHPETEFFKQNTAVLCVLAKLTSVTIVERLPSPCHAPVRLLGQHKLMLDIQIDIETERKKIQAELEKVNAELQKSLQKLGNAGFIERAPQAVVVEEQKRQHEWQLRLSSLQAQMEKLK